MSLILSGGWVVTMNDRREVLEGAAVLVVGDRIAEIGSLGTLQQRNREARVIDCTDSIIIPGLVNTHTHLFQTLLKGLGDDLPLRKWFACMTAPAAVHLTHNDAYVGALQGCIESLRSGVTTLVDFMYVHPRPDLTEAVLTAFEESGIRGFVARGFLNEGVDLGVPAALIETPAAALADARRLIEKHNRPGARVNIGIAPCMAWGVSAESLRETRKLSDETGALVTVHVAETPFFVSHSLESYGMSDTEWMGDVGLLNPKVLAVHCVECKSHDIRLLRHHDVKISHNPCSNMYLGSGLAPIPEMVLAGLTVSLGSDGPASSNNHSIIQAMKFAALIQKGFHRDATIMTAEKCLEMATIDGARAVGLEGSIGSIEVGKKADIAVVDCTDPFVGPIHNPVSALVYSALGHEVKTVLVDGQVVMEDRVIRTVDATRVRGVSQAAADALAQRAGFSGLKVRPWRSIGF
jgi:5-methylthioadenosine/S-adenosylhomocysteine deaminase